MTYVTHCTDYTHRHSRHCGSRSFLLSSTEGEAPRPAFESAGTSRETPYTFLNLARRHCKRWKELLLLQRPAKRSNPTAVAGRPTEDHLRQRSPDQGKRELRDDSVHGHDEFAFSRPNGLSRRSPG